MVQSKRFLPFVLMIVIGLMPIHIFAQQQSARIFLVDTFDYPGVGNSTTPFGINDRGDIAGDYLDSSNVRRGFVRFGNGNFSPPIVAPGDTGNSTRARGINNRHIVAGDFSGAGNSFHGYFLHNGVFTQFDVEGSFSTFILGINDAGDFVGATANFSQPNRPFVNIGGTSTIITIPGAVDGQAVGINLLNQVVGSYRDSGLVEHGFIRSPSGASTNSIDFPGASSTVITGINNFGWMVGRYTDSNGREHGFLRKKANTFVSFDFPHAAATALNGINDFGFIAGRYTDNSGIRHGFVAWTF